MSIDDMKKDWAKQVEITKMVVKDLEAAEAKIKSLMEVNEKLQHAIGSAVTRVNADHNYSLADRFEK